MTRAEAMIAMKKGEKVMHDNFSRDEFISMRLNGSLVDEDGNEMKPSDYWKWRTSESWEDDWQIYKED